MVASGLQKNLADQKHMGYARFRPIFILSKFGDNAPTKTALSNDPIFTTYPWNFFFVPFRNHKISMKKG